ncbi:Uncharacterized protein Fot_00827 [Forsythia ovata]|uniref:Uncharacterized protein n=1 Tax=Forsythia ovata TaxID=205694 RepID=A0ABD1X561_9LAMI
MARLRTRGARSVEESPPERTVAESESETHGVEPPPPTYATVDQFETLQTQMTAMMTLLQNQIHASTNHVTSPPVDPSRAYSCTTLTGRPSSTCGRSRGGHVPSSRKRWIE